jgi:hypothetical protein
VTVASLPVTAASAVPGVTAFTLVLHDDAKRKI